MKKVSFILAALATIAVAAPTMASAENFGFHVGVGPDHYYRDHDNYRGREFYGHDRGWHRGRYHHDGDRVIIRRHHDWDD